MDKLLAYIFIYCYEVTNDSQDIYHELVIKGFEDLEDIVLDVSILGEHFDLVLWSILYYTVNDSHHVVVKLIQLLFILLVVLAVVINH